MVADTAVLATGSAGGVGQALVRGFSDADSTALNLGNGNGFSIRQVIEKARQVTGRDFQVVEAERRPGGPPLLVAEIVRLPDRSSVGRPNMPIWRRSLLMFGSGSGWKVSGGRCVPELYR